MTGNEVSFEAVCNLNRSKTLNLICDNSCNPQRPLLSIVTIFRNASNYLQTNFNSFLRQQINPELINSYEHILIDGLSNDGSKEMAIEYATHSKQNVRVYSQKDRGIADAFNRGIAASDGEWIWFLNADDFLASANSIEKVLNRINKISVSNQEQSIIAGNMSFTDEAGLTNLGIVVPRFDKIRFGMYVPHPTLIVRRSLFDEYGGFLESFKISMDYEWLLRIDKAHLCTRSKVALIDQVLVVYRRIGISSRQASKSWKENLAARLLHGNVYPAIAAYIRSNIWTFGSNMRSLFLRRKEAIQFNGAIGDWCKSVVHRSQ